MYVVPGSHPLAAYPCRRCLEGGGCTPREWFDTFKAEHISALEERAFKAGLTREQRQHYRRVKELEERIRKLQAEVEVHAAACGYAPLHQRAPAGQGDRE